MLCTEFEGFIRAGRAMLKLRRSLVSSPDAFQEFIGIRSRISVERQKELLMERMQRRIEQLAYEGLDGPRPCMCMGAMPVYKNVEASFQQLISMMPIPSKRAKSLTGGQGRGNIAGEKSSGNMKKNKYWMELYRKSISEAANLGGRVSVNKHNVKYAGTDGATPGV